MGKTRKLDSSQGTKETVTHTRGRFNIRRTNEEGYYQMYFHGSEELINKLNEEKSIEAMQREMERISLRTDMKIRKVVYQQYWRPNLRVAETFQKGRVFLVGGKQLPQ